MADCPIYGIGICGGALGLELGVEVAIPGYRTACVVEREIAVAGRIAQRIREGSLPPLAWWDDVGSFDGRPWRGVVHILSAGFPCQPFSVAGKRKGTEDERWIWPDIARVIEELGRELELVFLENVPGLLFTPDSDFDRWDLEASPTDAIRGFGTVLGDLARLGFDAKWMCLRASDVGASHGRKRVFILAYRRLESQRVFLESIWTKSAGGGQRMEDAGCAGIGRTSQSSGFHRRRASDDDRRTDGTLDDSYLSRRTREVRQARTGRNATDSTGAIVGNPDEPGYPVRRDDSGLRECKAAERAGGTMGNAESGGRRELRESPERGIGLTDGSNPDVEHATCTESARLEQLRDILSGPADLFAYGPSDPRWESLLVRYPWLRPSYSQAEAESDLRELADGMAALVVAERTGALRALGNGVVPLQAALAFRVLLGRVIRSR